MCVCVVVSQDFRPQLSQLYCFIFKGAQVCEAWESNLIGFARIILSKGFFASSFISPCFSPYFISPFVSLTSSPLTLFCVLCWPVRLPPFILGIKGVYFHFYLLPFYFLDSFFSEQSTDLSQLLQVFFSLFWSNYYCESALCIVLCALRVIDKKNELYGSLCYLN